MRNLGRVICSMCLSLCGASLPAANVFAATPVLDVTTLTDADVSLSPYFAVLEDPSRELRVQGLASPQVAARFKGDQPDIKILNFGRTESAYWFRLELRNPGDAPVLRLMEIRNISLADIRLYQTEKSRVVRVMSNGAAIPVSQRAYQNRLPVFPVNVPARSEQTVYVRLQSRYVLMPAHMWLPESFERFTRAEYVRDAWYFGVVSAMLLFNLFIFASLRDRLYLLYVAAGAALALTLACQMGLAKEYLWPNAGAWWTTNSYSFFACLAVATYGQFFRRMLHLRETAPRLDTLLKVVIGTQLVAACAPLISDRIFIQTSLLLMLACVGILLAVSVLCCFKRMRNAYFLTAAFSLLLVGAILRLFIGQAWMPPNFFNLYALQFGSAAEMLILAFALADRFSMIRRKAIMDVEAANASLADRLQAREVELTAAHERLREAEMRQTLSNERQRLMQDMHDGLGSSLVTALRSIERGGMRETEVTSVLQGCIDDLKLAIDSMEPVEADLLLLLATLRFRLGQHIERAGIGLHWNIDDVPKLHWLDPRNALHILRILQEAIANIIKHTQANEICVATIVDGEQVHVSITDNGQGFQLEEALARGGKGLPNQMRRAEAIGGTVRWTSTDTGTCFTLTLPVERANQLVVTES